MANLRGRLLPVLDLCSFLGTELSAQRRQRRVLVVEHLEVFVGLMVDEVLGMQHFDQAGFQAGAADPDGPAGTFIKGRFEREQSWQVFSPFALAQSQRFMDVAVTLGGFGRVWINRRESMSKAIAGTSTDGTRSRSQIIALFIALIVFIVLLFANFAYLNTQASYDKQYIGHAGELRVLSQRIAKNATGGRRRQGRRVQAAERCAQRFCPALGLLKKAIRRPTCRPHRRPFGRRCARCSWIGSAC